MTRQVRLPRAYYEQVQAMAAQIHAWTKANPGRVPAFVDHAPQAQQAMTVREALAIGIWEPNDAGLALVHHIVSQWPATHEPTPAMFSTALNCAKKGCSCIGDRPRVAGGHERECLAAGGKA